MLWFTNKLKVLAESLFSIDLRQPRTLEFVRIVLEPLEQIRRNTLYQNSHNGEKIYLEKVLNEYFNIPGYTPQDHKGTRMIYIEDVPRESGLYIYQTAEAEITYLEDGDYLGNDIYLPDGSAGDGGVGFIIYVPDAMPLDEVAIRTQVEIYRYENGKSYTIQTYS